MSNTSAIGNWQKTIQQIIDENESTSKEGKRKTGELGKDDFLNLLVTQLRYQDPLNPTDDKEFIGQMAQFSSLEQMQNLNTSFTATKAYGLIGKNVTATITDSTTKETKEINGEVSSVKVSSGKYYVVIDGTEVEVDSVTDVKESSFAESNNLAAFINLIGKKANGIVYNSEDGDMIKVGGTVKSLQKGVYEDYAVMDGVEAEISGLNTTVKTTDADYVKNKLTTAYENGEEVDIIIKDSDTGKYVPVTATLAQLNIAADGRIKAVLNNLHVPLESITNITIPAETAATTEEPASGSSNSGGTATGTEGTATGSGDTASGEEAGA